MQANAANAQTSPEESRRDSSPENRNGRAQTSTGDTRGNIPDDNEHSISDLTDQDMLEFITIVQPTKQTRRTAGVIEHTCSRDDDPSEATATAI